ncbi:39S ribosomal protein L30, mitochondrial [Papilio xuthus]|uniref:Large ribosomal subunit protein uL30m n=1 Tax=Papilio xuthus TaxID=66420 RepID=I4DL52_PAPXU|nr:39S ribosomal protein L30, mitochondrial [Papilio xuthus]KPI95484.1 39S ribosomal protein L30, mitochondrial [Papilio xuthus]BAM18642.1 mitochondrial ribosomal protein L30 [Papilio xuthus]
MDRQLLKILNPVFTSFSRSKGFKARGGLRYPGGIVYFPRSPDHKDPEYTPSKLFRVERIRPVKNNPWWQKLILKELKIDEENRVTVVKNIPEINSRLWKIKHLIKLTPITFPYGEPSEEDINHTILKENGQCIVTKTLAPHPTQIEALEKFDNNKNKMDSTTIKKDSRYKWNNAYGGGF